MDICMRTIFLYVRNKIVSPVASPSRLKTAPQNQQQRSSPGAGRVVTESAKNLKKAKKKLSHGKNYAHEKLQKKAFRTKKSLSRVSINRRINRFKTFFRGKIFFRGKKLVKKTTKNFRFIFPLQNWDKS